MCQIKNFRRSAPPGSRREFLHDGETGLLYQLETSMSLRRRFIFLP
jgi:hypothetical protein